MHFWGEFCKIFKNTCFLVYLWTSASVNKIINFCILTVMGFQDRHTGKTFFNLFQLVCLYPQNYYKQLWRKYLTNQSNFKFQRCWFSPRNEVISLQYTTWTRDVNWTYIRRSASECRMNVQFTPCIHEGVVSSKDVKLFTFRIFTWCRF